MLKLPLDSKGYGLKILRSTFYIWFSVDVCVWFDEIIIAIYNAITIWWNNYRYYLYIMRLQFDEIIIVTIYNKKHGLETYFRCYCKRLVHSRPFINFA